MALVVIQVAIVALVPYIDVLIETIEPVGRGWQVSNSSSRDIFGYKTWDWVANKHVGKFDIIPKKFPNICLRRSLLHHKVTSDLNVASIKDWSVRCQLLDQRN